MVALLKSIQSGDVLNFAVETEAEEFVAAALKPFCKSIVRQPEFSNGLRPDLGIRLLALPDAPLAIEIKRFAGDGIGSTTASAIAQASCYAKLLGNAAFIAPLLGKGPSQFTWHSSSVGAMLLVAGQFSVGGLYFTGFGADKHGRMGGLMLGGMQIALFTFDGYGDPSTTLHPNAANLIKYKNREGSQSWRQ